jgi:hypothetical protein
VELEAKYEPELSELSPPEIMAPLNRVKRIVHAGIVVYQTQKRCLTKLNISAVPVSFGSPHGIATSS